MRILCFDDALRQSAPLPLNFRWSAAERIGGGELASPGAAVVRHAADLERLAQMLPASVYSVLPLIALDDALCDRADLVVGPSFSAIVDALRILQPSIQRAAQLPLAYTRLRDNAAQLLAYLVVRDAPLKPSYDPGLPEVVGYGVAGSRFGHTIVADAAHLSDLGYLQARFFDRTNTCPSCSSARLLLREECSACRGGRVKDEAIIHHLRCAYQAAESRFERGADLVCPKCRQQLNHFSVDYDKPGMALVCGDCGHMTGEPAIGFRCIDCGMKDDAERLIARDVNAYELKHQGRTAVYDPAWLARFSREADLAGPERHQMARHEVAVRNGEPTSLLELRVHADHASWRWWRPRSPGDSRTRALIGRLIKEHFDGAASIVESQGGYQVRIPSHYDDVERQLPELERKLKTFVAGRMTYDLRVLPAAENAMTRLAQG
ncbi:hypothetical protein [Bosea sp. CRIB-10]|uniref:TackOD1 domain-containing metal-binding protein n=1 Tax=Bosea sp. CRIB-10 TaxID=378404 RepID=UPI00111330E6|nr:hypothetical protein [Bosea sp. CRIB-10]